MSQNAGTLQTLHFPLLKAGSPTRIPVLEQVAKEFSFQLPVKLLRTIFEEYLRLDLPIQVLLGVNRQWRTVALETQSLWRRILLSADAIPGSLRARSIHLCASEGPAMRILNKSGIITNLEVAFVLGPKEAETPTPETRASLFQTVGHTALHRISFLSIIVNREMTLPLVTASLKDVFRGSLPSLESLMIASAQAIGNLYEPLGALMYIIELSSAKLKSLYLENVNNDFILQASTKTFWTRLVRIAIRNELDSLDASLFSLSPDLEFFSFSGELVATPAPFTAHLDSALKTLIEFPELKWLRVGLISMGTLARLHLPKLHTMTVDCVQGNYPSPAPPPGTLHLPKLHTMTIDCVQGNYPSPAPPPGTLHLPALKVLQIATVNPSIACIDAPNLDILRISIPAPEQVDANNILKMVFYGGEGMMRPKHLTLHGPVQDLYLIAALRCLGEKLVSLELDSQMPLGETFWTEMTPSGSTQHGWASAASSVASVTSGAYANTGAVSTGAGAISIGRRMRYKSLLLPNLRCLVVDVHKNPMAQGEGRELRILLMKLIEGRRVDAEYENLLRLACRWREGPGVEEIVDPPICPSCTDAATTTTRNLDAHKYALSQKSPAEISETMYVTCVIPAFRNIGPATEPPDLYGQVDLLNTRPFFVGNYSDVYIGVYERRKVAVKKLRSLKGPRVMKRKFRRELFIAWNLRHRNLMSLEGYFYGYDDKGEVYYHLVSKWAERGSAAQYIYNAHLSWNKRLNLVHNVAGGLAYLHSFIVHGDLKPANVLIDEHGIAQICDFGLSRLLQDYESTPLNTTTGHTGTVRYLAKELVDTKNAVPTWATDVYALGCVAHEFIYRTPPHAALDIPWQIYSAIHEGRPPAKRPVGSKDIPILWGGLEYCWSTDPSERPTAQAFFEYLGKTQEAMEIALSAIYNDLGNPIRDSDYMDTLN